MNGQRVGVIGDERTVETIERGGGVAVADRSEFDDVAFVVVEGDEAVVDFARESIDVPVVVVGSESEFSAVPRDRLGSALDPISRDEPRIVSHPVIAASGSFGTTRIVFDVALMAAEPARISEFSVAGPSGHIDRFRADGVVASTPIGSHGYSRRAGGPVVAAETGVATVVPIAPFSIEAEHWVLPIDSVELSIERDETAVELLADGRRERVIDTDDTVRLSRAGSIETYVFSETSAHSGE